MSDEKQTLYRFKVRRGKLQWKGKVYKPGEIVTTPHDLRKHNLVPGQEKFELLPHLSTVKIEDGEPQQQADDDATGAVLSRRKLSTMKLDELKQLAEENEIDIEGAANKVEIINLIFETIGGE